MENTRLIKNLKKGDQKTFKEVYLAYFDRLVHVARKFEFKFLTPEDFVQETFLHLYKQKHLLKEDVLFDKQLFVICKNIIINHVNRENKVISLDPLKVVLYQEDEEEDHLQIEVQKKQLLALLNQLPEQQRKIFTLHKLDNYSYREIAEITKLSEKTIANHIYLANKFITKKTACH
ncbi:sigma-70 family RNA polymerase sigma factor [Flavobacterium salilacus subsp. salilacus]|uniref:RNA polymerase sigma factor n=1 Tax=Flavobacterium TaxID=237 RepID=UPI001074DD9C|nr:MULTISPECIES: sigma-70 family RNA polymerase sigma factor [Flavobacterium]KAF2515439.1 sigma-70 family RNA polymerase sigma factor [Flavobacterium salilacus subsp. salilacus]MBE1615834.1 sigma-70 family RNA polymerase sigma factor [Flavobacterium sp. SaA2.13]NDJ00034.1 sigma-70 family RNA polymerase sigma factor [Flavobacterium salilacus subsp. altitudinum]